MVIRKLKKFVPAALVAALIVVGGSFSATAQQVISSVGSGCAGCSSGSPFSSTVVSSTPTVASGVVLSNGNYSTSGSQMLPLYQPFQQTQLLPTTSSFAASNVSNGIIQGQSFGTYAMASGSQSIVSEPSGTFTSMSVSPAVTTISSTPMSVTQPIYASPTTQTVTSTYAASPANNGIAGRIGSGLAQLKAQRAASGSIRGHVGGSLGGARYEGVGWSSQSPQSAIQQCCYWGTRPVSQIGVSRGADGLWYACVLYR